MIRRIFSLIFLGVACVSCKPNNTQQQTNRETGSSTLAGHSQPHTGIAYTEVTDGENLTLPTATRRLALLIGNVSYEQAPPAEDGDSDKRTLNHLDRPCSDVEAVASTLSHIGWHKDELFVLCDQSNKQIYGAISALLSAAPLDPSKPRLMMLYLSGHGMLVDSRNYFFGSNTRVDWESKFDELEKSVSEGKEYQLFDKSEGVDLDYAFSGIEGKLSYPLLVVVDACRDNPFIAEINRSAMNAKEKNGSSAEASAMNWNLILDRISSVARASNPPRGMEYVYATKPNATIQDDGGKGRSRLTDEIVNHAVAGKPIRTLIFDMQDDLDHVNKSLPKPEWQSLSYQGDLYTGEDWCLNGCRWPGADAQVTRAASSQTNTFPFDLLTPAAYAAAVPSSGPSLSNPAVTVVRRYPTTSPRRVLVDIHWCSGDRAADNRFNDARRFADRLREKLDVSNPRVGQSQIYGLRLSELTASENDLARYQRRTDTLYVNNVHVEPEENRLAATLLRPLLDGISVRVTDNPTKDYIDVSFCRGAYTGIRAPRVFVQIATAKGVPDASIAIAAMNTASPDLSIDPSPDNMSIHPGFHLSGYPTHTQFRVTNPNLRARAEKLSMVLNPLVGKKIPVDCISECKGANPGRAIELWLGQVDHFTADTMQKSLH